MTHAYPVLLLEVTRRGGQAFVQVGVLAVSVSAANRREHGVAARHLAFVQLAEVHSFVVGPEGPFITVRLLAEVTRDGQSRRQAGKALVCVVHQDADGVLIFPGDQARAFTGPITVLHEHGAFLTYPVRVPRRMAAALRLHARGSAQIQDGALTWGTRVVALQAGTVDLGYWINQTAHPTGSLEDDGCLGGLLCESHILIGLLSHIFQKVSRTEVVLTALQCFLGQYFLVEVYV